MNFGSLSHNGVSSRLIRFVVVVVSTAALVLVFVPFSSSQQLLRPPAWTVQSADAAHSSLTLKGSAILGIDTGMFWVVQFRIEGNSANQLASFQPNMAVVLETSGRKLQSSTAPGAKTGGKTQPQANLAAKPPTTSAVFTSIPTVGQTLVIQAAGISPVEAVAVSVIGPQSYAIGQPDGPTPPCCAVTVFNSHTGIATAKVNSSGQTFMFQAPLLPWTQEAPPPPTPLYQHINIGQPVWANLTTGQVSLDGKTVCCQITAEGISSSGPGVKPTPLGAKNPLATTAACCEITALHQQAKTASAKVKSNGQVFQIAVTNPALFQSLHVGQAIWANFQTHQVSLNGLGPVDGMQINAVIAHVPGSTITGKKPPYTAIPSPSSPPLTIQDHTLIMQAFIQNSAYIRQGMSRHNWLHATRNQVAMGVMLYLIKANTVPEATKERVRVAFQTMGRMRFGARVPADAAFHKQALTALRAASDASSAVQTLSNLEQRHANEPKHTAELNLAQTLVSDGSSTIYSPIWVKNNLRKPSSGGVKMYAEPLACSSGSSGDPSGSSGDDLGSDCFAGGCDPSTDPTCGGCDPATDPSCNACPDPGNPGCDTKPTCPDPTETYPNCTTCPDPGQTYPNCSTPPPPPPPVCNDFTNPNCEIRDPDTYGCMRGTGSTTMVIEGGQVTKEIIRDAKIFQDLKSVAGCAAGALGYSISAGIAWINQQLGLPPL